MKCTQGIALSLALISVMACSQEKTGPEPLAANMMSQFIAGVSEESVKVTVLNRTATTATAKAEANGHVCTMETIHAPAGVKAPYDWLVGSIKCDG